MVSVKVIHDTAKFLRRNSGSEGSENVVELGDADLAVTVGVEAVEDPLEFLHVLEVHCAFGV